MCERRGEEAESREQRAEEQSREREREREREEKKRKEKKETNLILHAVPNPDLGNILAHFLLKAFFVKASLAGLPECTETPCFLTPLLDCFRALSAKLEGARLLAFHYYHKFRGKTRGHSNNALVADLIFRWHGLNKVIRVEGGGVRQRQMPQNLSLLTRDRTKQSSVTKK